MDPVFDFDPNKVIRRKKYITPEEFVAVFYEKSEDEFVIVILKGMDIISEINVTNAWLSSKSVAEIDVFMDQAIAKVSENNPW